MIRQEITYKDKYSFEKINRRADIKRISRKHGSYKLLYAEQRQVQREPRKLPWGVR